MLFPLFRRGRVERLACPHDCILPKSPLRSAHGPQIGWPQSRGRCRSFSSRMSSNASLSSTRGPSFSRWRPGISVRHAGKNLASVAARQGLTLGACSGCWLCCFAARRGPLPHLRRTASSFLRPRLALAQPAAHPASPGARPAQARRPVPRVASRRPDHLRCAAASAARPVRRVPLAPVPAPHQCRSATAPPPRAEPSRAEGRAAQARARSRSDWGPGWDRRQHRLREDTTPPSAGGRGCRGGIRRDGAGADRARLACPLRDRTGIEAPGLGRFEALARRLREV
jgi:hypothetical protein